MKGYLYFLESGWLVTDCNVYSPFGKLMIMTDILLLQYLLQFQSLSLGKLGRLQLQSRKRVVQDDTTVDAPQVQIQYISAEDNLSPEQLQWFADRAAANPRQYFEQLFELVMNNHELLINGIGRFTKLPTGKISFIQELAGGTPFTAVAAKKVLRPAVLQDDLNIAEALPEDNGMKEDVVVEAGSPRRQSRWLWILLIASVLLLLIYLISTNFSLAGLGNQQKVTVTAP